MNNKKTIFFFVNSYVGKRGSIGLRAEKIINYLSRDKYNVFCISKTFKKNDIETIFSNLLFFTFFIKVIKFFRNLSKSSFTHRILDSKIYDILSIIYLKIIYRNVQIDVAHIWDYCPNLIKFLKKKGAFTILDVSIAPAAYAENLFYKFNLSYFKQSKTLKKLQLKSYLLADLIFVPSNFVANEINMLGVKKSKIIVIPFGVDLSKSKKSLRRYEKKSSYKYCYFGLLNNRKGISELLDIWNDPIFNNDSLHLCGKLLPEISYKIKNLSCKNIYTYGFVNPNDYMYKFDFFLFPSWMEGSSKAIYEAMSYGLPCIVTESSGSIIEHNLSGFIVETGNFKEFKNYMILLKNNNLIAKKIGKNALKRISHFSWSKYSHDAEYNYEKFS